MAKNTTPGGTPPRSSSACAGKLDTDGQVPRKRLTGIVRHGE
ncbi:hypothetical protein [Janthinobacterium sp. HLX7-2]